MKDPQEANERGPFGLDVRAGVVCPSLSVHLAPRAMNAHAGRCRRRRRTQRAGALARLPHFRIIGTFDRSFSFSSVSLAGYPRKELPPPRFPYAQANRKLRFGRVKRLAGFCPTLPTTRLL